MIILRIAVLVTVPSMLLSAGLYMLLGWPGALIGWALSLVWGYLARDLF